MTPPIRVLVVDDSAVMRRLVRSCLESEPDIEVVGVAKNGREGLEKMEALDPDLVTLDVEMPILNGLETLTELRKRRRRVPVIMFSTLTERGAHATIEALTLGASDYATKPSGVSNLTEGKQRVRADLLPKVRALAASQRRRLSARLARTPGPLPRRVPPPPAVAPTPAPESGVAVPSTLRSPPQPPPRRTSIPRGPPLPVVIPPNQTPARRVRRGRGLGRIDTVVIGVSTGGPQALAELVETLPANLSVPILIVQHMPPLFTRMLAERLDSRSELRFVEATDGMAVTPGVGYLAPGDFHMVLEMRSGQPIVALNQAAPVNSCRPAADVLFRSVARHLGPTTLAVVLTGMGRDGADGCTAIAAAGGRLLVQDRDSSVVWGMPGAVVGAGLEPLVLPLSDIGPEIVRVVCGGVTSAGPSRHRGQPRPGLDP